MTQEKNLQPLPRRFWAKVKRTPTCWLWTGATTKGYGIAWWNGRTVSAHRLSYEARVARIPPNTEIDHVCRNRACVNPAHLRAVDHRTNVLAGIGTSAVNAAKACCPKGHPYRVVKRGATTQRRCMICRAAREKTQALSRAKKNNPWQQHFARAALKRVVSRVQVAGESAS